MKALSAALQAHLDSGTTTLAWCWRIERSDGVVFGFTDHDRPVAFEGVTYEPESGFAASEIRSGVDLDDPLFRAFGSVTAVTGDRSFAASELGGFAAGWFTLGRLTWTSGPNAGRVAEVANHEVIAGARRLALLEAPVRPIAVGHGFVVRAGCDKRLETCCDRFANVANFRGFPHIPGQDTVIRYPNRGDANSGEVL